MMVMLMYVGLVVTVGVFAHTQLPGGIFVWSKAVTDVPPAVLVAVLPAVTNLVPVTFNESL